MSFLSGLIWGLVFGRWKLDLSLNIACRIYIFCQKTKELDKKMSDIISGFQRDLGSGMSV